MDNTPILPASAFLDAQELFLPSQVGIEPLAAVARALRGFDREQLGSAIEVLIALLDVADGNPDAENATDAEDDFALSPLAEHFAAGPGCIIADEDAGAYVEWTSKPANRRDGPETIAGGEDDETVSAEDDFHPNGGSFTLGRGWPAGPGCPIADPDEAIDDGPCDEPNQDLEPDFDNERDQMSDDVPMLPVFGPFNIFTDKRVPLGIGNLMSSFVGKDVRSADTGAVHSSRATTGWPEPGVPV